MRSPSPLRRSCRGDAGILSCELSNSARNRSPLIPRPLLRKEEKGSQRACASVRKMLSGGVLG